MSNITIPQLNVLCLDSHSDETLIIADTSAYPPNFNIVSPSVSITVPGYNAITLPFTPMGIQVYNSTTLGITQFADGCSLAPLPDGIYTITYSIAPAYEYYVTKTILRTEQIYQAFDSAYMKLDMMQCDRQLKREDEEVFDLIEFYIQGAIAAANNCASQLAMQLYTKASQLLYNYTNNICYQPNGWSGGAMWGGCNILTVGGPQP